MKLMCRPGTGYDHTTYSNHTTTYPCDRGTGTPVGWHHFEASPNGVVVCIYCGQKPSNPRPGHVPLPETF